MIDRGCGRVDWRIGRLASCERPDSNAPMNFFPAGSEDEEDDVEEIDDGEEVEEEGVEVEGEEGEAKEVGNG
ncbi:hypothetical protein scyTo_0025361 [Scyliorhinus torazame]|uniref:Uncharacterized protein n=1 Tax=Scyliorhinus torazame TaxID=75743 RepID=A0A401QGZ0_SCYTO|nr:hypothetical protein [Scyliorhinus torazame]